MTPTDTTPSKAAPVRNHSIHCRWLSALTALHYRAGQLDVYLEELVSGLRHGLGASWVMLGQRAHPAGAYQVTISPDLQPGSGHRLGHDVAQWSTLAQSIETQSLPTLGLYPMEAGLSIAYCGVPLQTSQGEGCGILLVLRPSIEPFQGEDHQILTLMAGQATMAIELEQCYPVRKPTAVGTGSFHPLQRVQDKLVVSNQQLTQKLDQYRAELQRVSAQLQVESIAHVSLEQRFRKIFEGSNDAIFVIDPAQDRILEANPRASQLLNYSRQELVTTVRISQVHPEEMPALMAFTRTVFKDGQGWTDELTCLTKSKHRLAAEISAAPIEVEGQPCIIAMVRDISGRKRAEADAKKALSHLAEVGELASMIVHEIRNPLTTVLMGLTSFKKLNLDHRFKARLTLALEEAERLKRLLNEILLFSKPQALDCKPLELNKWSLDLLDSLRSHPSVSNRSIRFIPNPIPTIVSADSDKLKQVFINLITNACEAIHPGDRVTWEITHPSKAQHLIVSIQNGGNPIPASILSKITTPFFTTKTTGNGLGLAIVKRIVNAHQGQLTIASDASTGTRVTVTLPLLKK